LGGSKLLLGLFLAGPFYYYFLFFLKHNLPVIVGGSKLACPFLYIYLHTGPLLLTLASPLYMCPHTTIYVSSYYYISSSYYYILSIIYVSSYSYYCVCPHTTICVVILLCTYTYMQARCLRRFASSVSTYYYICVCILQCMSSHYYVSSYYMQARCFRRSASSRTVSSPHKYQHFLFIFIFYFCLFLQGRCFRRSASSPRASSPLYSLSQRLSLPRLRGVL
jgi:hypothetical protein